MTMEFTPKHLFLIDGIGALITATLLGLVLTRFEASFGMPTDMLYPLATTALVFSLYSLLCYLLLFSNWAPFLKIIAICNGLYCLVTLILAILLFDSLTWLGVGYFLGEIGIVSTLATIEWRNSAMS